MSITDRFREMRDDYGMILYNSGDPGEWIERICELESLIILMVEEGTFFPTGELDFHANAIVDEVVGKLNELDD